MNNKRETLQERNQRLRWMVAELTKENRALKDSDRAWSMCCESLKRKINDLKFEYRKILWNSQRRPSWWRRFINDLTLWPD